ncbi:hypothetical protein Emin_0966 [Elusimicrobium minutum Pei191]|uniref:Uncharacterized protein n=1 Tax=Elusimicrobium minutum (strain Pei191) TaxID=445932 RepID=B2KDC3_ELUMP|nr:hypothetical protein [Elusimicrobium minutum]ACC98519.1 hypothetical protein Emin_0966 [Elusimicrobium minutum Pei191]
MSKKESMNDMARKEWEKSGLKYSDISEAMFLRLVKILDETLRKNTSGINDLCVTMKPKKYAPVFKKDYRGGMREAYIYCRADYFTGREAISFNSDGFIGFCGWACTTTTEPFIEAFKIWIKELLEE